MVLRMNYNNLVSWSIHDSVSNNIVKYEINI